MITHSELEILARRRLRDARILQKNNRHDAAVYLCGYGIELGLKAIICKNLKLKGIPNIATEFRIIKDIKTHNLEDLLKLVPQNIAQDIKSIYLGDWSIIQKWNPEMRYSPDLRRLTTVDSGAMISASTRVLRYLWRQI